jgi:hypothetical protein
VHVNNPSKDAGAYTVIFSPNDFTEWFRFTLVICYVKEPRYLFADPEYSFKFRPEQGIRKYFISDWLVKGGSDSH